MKAFLIEEFRAFKNMKTSEGKSKKKSKSKKTKKWWGYSLSEPSFDETASMSKPKQIWREGCFQEMLVVKKAEALYPGHVMHCFGCNLAERHIAFWCLMLSPNDFSSQILLLTL